MSTQTIHAVPINGAEESVMSRTAAGFTLAAVITLIFNTLLTIVKDYYDPLNAAFQKALGHHWITHGVVDIGVFFALGLLLSAFGTGRGMPNNTLIGWLVTAAVINGAGIALWFLLY